MEELDGLNEAIARIRLDQPASAAKAVHAALVAMPEWSLLELSAVKRACSKMAKVAAKVPVAVPVPVPAAATSDNTPASQLVSGMTASQKTGVKWGVSHATMIEAALTQRLEDAAAESLDVPYVFILDLRVLRGQSSMDLKPKQVLKKARLVPMPRLAETLDCKLRFERSWAEREQAALLARMDADSPGTFRRGRAEGEPSEVCDVVVALAVGDLPPQELPDFCHSTIMMELYKLLEIQADAVAEVVTHRPIQKAPEGAEAPVPSGDESDFQKCCAVCHVHGHGRLLACAGCETVWYCSKDHQREHWKATHKHGCLVRQQLTDIFESQIHRLEGNRPDTTARVQAISRVSSLGDAKVAEMLTAGAGALRSEEVAAEARMAFFSKSYKDLAKTGNRVRTMSAMADAPSSGYTECPANRRPDSNEVKKQKGLERTRRFYIDINMSKQPSDVSMFKGLMVYDVSDIKMVLHHMPADIEYKMQLQCLRDLDPAVEFMVRVTNDGRGPALLALCRFDGE
eukprot:scaffold43858_cov30-Phaeocystis_antarctica.AAC.2